MLLKNHSGLLTLGSIHMLLAILRIVNNNSVVLSKLIAEIQEGYDIIRDDIKFNVERNTSSQTIKCKWSSRLVDI